jgi:GT2 family glycosyltransferase
MSAALTVVIPTYTRSDLLAECLKSLAAQTFRDFEVIVVDDASPQDVADCVARAYPSARVIRRAENGGFARTANAGVRAATTPHLMLLNDDMTLAPDCIERLMTGLRESGAAMACPLVLFRDQPDIIYSAGDRITRGGRPESIGFRQKRDGFEFQRNPWGVSAGAALYAREVFDTIGHFDELFVAYFEDADLCLRARRAGFAAVCVPEAVAYHVGSASQTGSTTWRTRQCYRNHALLVAKHFSTSERLARALWILIERMHQSRRVFTTHRAEAGFAHAVRAWWGARMDMRQAVLSLRDAQ